MGGEGGQNRLLPFPTILLTHIPSPTNESRLSLMFRLEFILKHVMKEKKKKEDEKEE